MSTSNPPQQPSEEELRAAYEAQMSKIRVEHVLFDQVSMLVDLGMRRTGLIPGTESERDLGQVRLAIEGVKAIIPLVEQFAADQIPQIQQAVSQLQLAFVRAGGTPPPGGEAAAPEAAPPTAETPPAPAAPPAPPEPSPGAPAPGPGEPGPGPAQKSGRLWVPGQ